MMNGFDLGGCCLARYGATSNYFPSKTEKIMSKYRPIAPKPILQSAAATGVQAPQICAPLAIESGRGSSGRGCGRNRKRALEALAAPTVSPSPRPVKRVPRNRSAPSSISSEAPPTEGTSSYGCAAAAPPPPPAPTVHRHRQSDLSDETASTVCNVSPESNNSSGVSKANNTKNRSAFPYGGLCGMSSDSSGFMDRAAAANVRGGAAGGETEAESERVTLPLLPKAPCAAPNKGKTGIDGNNCKNISPPVIDSAALERVYGATMEPMVLVTNGTRQIIWYNVAYSGMVSSYVPDLIYSVLPKPLASFTIANSAGSPASGVLATLWGFVRLQLQRPQNSNNVVGSRLEPACTKSVITPQPLRPIGSTITVECVTELPAASASSVPSAVSVEVLEEQLERERAPALLTDTAFRVRWANSAYRQMVGQPECAWLSAPAEAVGEMGRKISRINGDVGIVFGGKGSGGEGGGGFSCRVKIQWEKNSMTVPCDVFRLSASASSETFYAWRFDVDAALSL
eukprot:TRINITY_DN3243_c0_g1_i1.p1 TRINITY_DN3243_c0_g1~~TRINITY_DN3243_c0_g1_i1.p1  ORF type:complete len:513 (-),score=-39.15 TRINITY_DN3243_c0_g1_i1:482-2020(-)